MNEAEVLEEEELPIGVHPVEGLVAAVLRQAVRDVQDVVLGDRAGRGRPELVEQVGLLQQQLLEGALAPLDQVLQEENEMCGIERRERNLLVKLIYLVKLVLWQGLKALAAHEEDAHLDLKVSCLS